MTISKLAFVFPGQGSQEIGMGQELANNVPEARSVYDKANDILGFPLSDLCFSGPEADLNDTINTQVAIFVTSMATLAALRSAGYTAQPDYVAGHSLGEYSAYVAAGVLSFEDGLNLVRMRGRLMKEAGTVNSGGMAAILKLDDATVEDICRQVTANGEHGTLQVANYNAPGQVVISGNTAAVDRGIELAKAAKARRVAKLPVSIAAHSKLMRTISDEFRAAINQIPLNLPDIPVVANISALPLESTEDIRQEMEAQLTSSVQWTKSVQWMIENDTTQFVEIGPKDVLKGLIRRINKQVKTVSVSAPKDIQNLLEA